MFSSSVISPKGPRDLEGAAEAQRRAGDGPGIRRGSAVEPDLAAVRPEAAGDAVEQRRLAGAVRADQAGDLAAPTDERHLVDGRHAAEVLRDRPDLEHTSLIARVDGPSAIIPMFVA